MPLKEELKRVEFASLLQPFHKEDRGSQSGRGQTQSSLTAATGACGHGVGW